MKKPVLILGYIPRIVTPVARSLHRQGVPVDVADFLSGPRPRSRAIRQFVRLPYAYRDPTGFVDSLCSFISQRGHDVLMPADDYALAVIELHYARLKDLLHIACPPPNILQLVLNKRATLRVAQECGLNVPRTVVVSDTKQLLDLMSSFPMPTIVKPAGKHQRYDEFKSCMIASAADVALHFPTSCEFAPPMLLQEYCPGIGVGVEILIHKGECMAAFQHRRLKELPYGGGVSVTAVAERLDPVLFQSSLTLLRALQWEGVAMVEFKVNPADGRPVVMEVNGRYWGTISLPILAGVDFPAYQWKLLHDEPFAAPDEYAVGAKWRWTVGYFVRIHGLLSQARYSKTARKELLQTVLDSPKDFGASLLDSLLTVSDPIPAISELLRALRYYLLHDLKKLFKRPDDIPAELASR